MNEIVLVDDNADHVELMLLAIRSPELECEVRTFASGDAVLAAIDRGQVRPRLVVLDFNMAGLDGPGCARRLRDLPAMRGVPIVMLSTSEQRVDVQRARAAGADSFVAKPSGDETWHRLMATVMHYWLNVDLCGRS